MTKPDQPTQPTPEDRDRKINLRGNWMTALVCDAIWGAEHGWESATDEQFADLMREARHRLTAQAAREEEVRELLGNAALLIRSLKRDLRVSDHLVMGESGYVSDATVLAKIDALTKPKEARDGEDR